MMLMSDDRSRTLDQHRITRRAFLRATAGTLGIASVGLISACNGSGSASGDDELVIEMTDEMVFEPDPVSIPAGSTVIFRNVSGGFVHTATCDPDLAGDPEHVALPSGAAPWDSGNVQPGESWSTRLETPGEYRYVCLPHELAGMVGTIVVEAG